MDKHSGRRGRLAALAVIAGLTVALVASVRMQAFPAPASSRAEDAARAACAERLVRAAERARAEGDETLAEWIEALPTFPRDEPIAALP